MSRFIRSSTAVALAGLLAAATVGVDAKDRRECDRDYKPQVGQSGKDVVWVPTPDEVVQRMLRMAKVTPQDTVYDLGAGDGKIAIAAGKMGATAVGIEYNPDMVELARGNVPSPCLNVQMTGMRGRNAVARNAALLRLCGSQPQ